MPKKLKEYFFGVPATAAYNRFRKNNIPSEANYRNLIASVPFFLEAADTATLTQQGLTKLGADADVILRASQASGNMQTVVRPHQLPLMVGGGDTEAATIDTAVEEGGLKLTPVNGASSTRMNFKIELAIDNLDTDVPVATDYFVFQDVTDGDAMKRALLSTVFVTQYWQRAMTTLSPATSNDSLDMGTGALMGGTIILDNSTDRSIIIASIATAAGRDLVITAGASTYIAGNTDGGDLILYSGAGAGSGEGGNIYVTATEAGGDVMFAWTPAGANYGTVGIGCAAVAGFMAKIDGDVQVTGNIQVDTPLTSAISTFIGLTAAKKLTERTALEFTNGLFGTPTKGDIIYYSGSAWARLGDPAADAWLKYNNTSDLPEWDTTGLNTDVKVGVDAAATAGYLGAADNDGVFRIASGGGLTWIDQGDYIEIEMAIWDLSSLPKAGRMPSNGYMAVTDPENSHETYKIPISSVFGTKSASGWLELEPGVDYTTTPPALTRVSTSDLTALYEKGMPIRYKLNSDASYRYGVINDIQATYIDIDGDPLVVAAAEIEELYIGDKSKVLTEKFVVNQANYNANTITTVLETINLMKNGSYWFGGSAKIVRITTINQADDGTVNPIVNMRIGTVTADYISTSNGNAGLLTSTTVNATTIDISTTKNTLEYGDRMEVKVDKNGGTGDADNLTVFATIVLK